MPDELPKLRWFTDAPDMSPTGPVDGTRSVWLDVPIEGRANRVLAFLPSPDLLDLYIVPRQFPFPNSSRSNSLIVDDRTRLRFYMLAKHALEHVAAGAEGREWLQILSNTRAGFKELKTIDEIKTYLQSERDFGYFDAYTTETGNTRLPEKKGKFLLFAPNEGELAKGRLCYPYEPAGSLALRPSSNGEGSFFMGCFSSECAPNRLGAVNEAGEPDGIIFPVTQMLKLVAWGIMANLGIMPNPGGDRNENCMIPHPWYRADDPEDTERGGYNFSPDRNKSYRKYVNVPRLELLVSDETLMGTYRALNIWGDGAPLRTSSEYDVLARKIDTQQAVVARLKEERQAAAQSGDEEAEEDLALCQHFESYLHARLQMACESFHVPLATLDSLQHFLKDDELVAHIQSSPADIDPKIWKFADPGDPYGSRMEPDSAGPVPSCSS
ncbi:hypothetical protein [Mycobacteroides abscessus]|uniref:hypothetical protein n=1 Tax=Mycobacteroides abscessus TaxID=36809 RepID=UPI000C261CEA|nr:hypothetical protein [Mycobacteroides abscessus]